MSRARKADNAKGTTTRDVNAAFRAKRALALRAQGKSYDDIAVECSYGSRGAAHHAVQRELQRVVVEDVQELRREQMEKLRRLEEECWKVLLNPKDNGRMFQVERIVSILERQARLMGLDTPVDQAQYMNMVIVQETPQGYLTGGTQQ